MSGENNPHFSPFGDLNPGAHRNADDLTPEAAYLRDHPRVLAMFDEFTDPTLADMKRFNDAVKVVERWAAPKR